MRWKLIQAEYYSIENQRSQSHTMKLFCILLHCDFYKQEWSTAPSIFNIKARGLAHCLYQLKLSLNEIYEVCFRAIQTVSDGRACKKYFFANSDKSQVCLQEQNKSNGTIKRLLINTVTAYMPIDEITIVRLFISIQEVAQKVLYSTIVKQKNRMCKSKPLLIAKL